MKKVIYIALIGFLLTTSCKKENKICTTNTELNNGNHLVDLSALSSAPELLDSLSKYPHLQVFRIIDDEYMTGIHCNIFYQGLEIFTDHYRLFKSKNNNSISGWDSIPTNINISLSPTIQHEQAIEIAKQSMNYNKTCISYRLGIFDKNTGISYQPKDYKLTWRVEGENGLPYVVLDANSGEIYRKHDGVYN